jgi:hypothetical protein
MEIIDRVEKHPSYKKWIKNLKEKFYSWKVGSTFKFRIKYKLFMFFY